MKLRGGAVTLSKRGNSAEENEDAYAPQFFENSFPTPFSCAVADGATETSYSGLWARLLVERFCSIQEPTQFYAALPELREAWKAATGSKSLSWYAEQKLEKGAFAAFLGVCITPANFPFLRWHVVSVGDSVLFHVRDAEIAAQFPPFASEDFKARPLLLSTGTDDSFQQELFHFKEGLLEAGDRLYLATDKIAEWIVRGLEKETKPFLQLHQMTRMAMTGAFAEMVETLVQHNEIKNDDYTLLWVEAHNEET